MPVYLENADDIVGILHTRDYLLKHRNPDFSLEQAMMPPTFIPESMHLDVLIKEMQVKHTHMVIVVNEYGVPSGIVTMEDILEEIVGEIWDESDEAIDSIQKLEDGTYRVLCTTSTEDFFEYFNITPEEETEATTVNGWLSENSGNIPDKGDTLEYQNLSITVTEADELMAHEIHVTIKEDEPSEEA